MARISKQTPEKSVPEKSVPEISIPEISILVPVMNEQGNIRPLIDEIAAVYAGRPFEIIYVNDASTDGTSADLADAQNHIPQLRVLHHQNRSGQSAAVRTALLAAKAPLIAVLDGDGQNIPSDLPALEAALLAARPARGMAGGVRVTRKDTALRRQASAVARWLRRSLLKDDHPDSGCGLKVVDRDIFVNLPFFNHMHRFMPALVRREGGCVIAVPVGHRMRARGRSKYGILDRLLVGISDMLGVIWLLRRMPKTGKVIEDNARKTSLKKSSKKSSGKSSKTASGKKAGARG